MGNDLRRPLDGPARVTDSMADKPRLDVIGIHMGHNSSVALIREGVLAAGIQEERITRIKNQGDFPAQSLQAVSRDMRRGTANGLCFAYAWKRLVRSVWQKDAVLKQYGVRRRGLMNLVKRSARKLPGASDFIDSRRVRGLEAMIADRLVSVRPASRELSIIDATPLPHISDGDDRTRGSWC